MNFELSMQFFDKQFAEQSRTGGCKLNPKFLSYPVAGMNGCDKFDGIRVG